MQVSDINTMLCNYYSVIDRRNLLKHYNLSAKIQLKPLINSVLHNIIHLLNIDHLLSTNLYRMALSNNNLG